MESLLTAAFVFTFKLSLALETFLELPDFSKSWVLTAGTKEVAKTIERDTTLASLIEKREGFPIVCVCLERL